VGFKDRGSGFKSPLFSRWLLGRERVFIFMEEDNEWEMGNGKWEMGNGKREMGNGKWERGEEHCNTATLV